MKNKINWTKIFDTAGFATAIIGGIFFLSQLSNPHLVQSETWGKIVFVGIAAMYFSPFISRPFWSRPIMIFAAIVSFSN